MTDAAYHYTHLRTLLDAAHNVELGVHELNRAKERVAVKITTMTRGEAAGQEAHDTSKFYGMEPAAWKDFEAKAYHMLNWYWRTTHPVDPKPYKVYTRWYKKNGDCDKRVHSFATEAQQRRFIATTKRAVTFVG